MTLHVSPSSYEQQLIAAYKARQARFAAAARKVPQDPKVLPKAVEFDLAPTRDSPLWMFGNCYFDAHLEPWHRWLAECREAYGSPLRTYIRDRALDLGSNYTEIMADIRRDEVVAVRHLLMWEIKTIIKPSITWPELGRLFGGRDHTSCRYAVHKIEAQKAVAA
jgi:Bacterial dnaA protein helix-turn-helix